MSIRVVVADDQELVRSGFAMILDAQPDIKVVAEAADGAQALVAVRTHRPDVALLDIRMPVLDGIAAARAVCAETSCRVLMLTTFDQDDYVYDALYGGPAASCSRTCAATTWCTRSGWSRPGRPCWLRPSPGG